jgi:homospermidine synthase
VGLFVDVAIEVWCGAWCDAIVDILTGANAILREKIRGAKLD